MANDRKIRVIVAKPGLDGHDRGAKVVAHGLSDAGFEVIYTGLHQTPEDVVQSVIQEDPDALLLSILSGAHKKLFTAITKKLEEQGINDVLILGGGIIPDQDIPYLKEHGIEEIFGPGTEIDEIVEYVKTHLKR
jgi:methylmalonyl-CoA mutase C-terminal domain/subunit